MTVHSCEYRGCINEAFATCRKKCGRWLCPKHLKRHSCKKVDAWAVASPSLNAVPDLEALDVAESDEDWKKKNR